MNIANTKQMLRTLIENKTPITPMLWARHGVGKSAIVQQLAGELGYRILTIMLSQKEAIDLTGMLYTYEDPKLGLSVTSNHPPVWFAEALHKGKVIVFLDEFNMARREVLNASFELVNDRRLNNMKLGDDVFVVCAGNPDDERYDVTPLSESLRDRLMHIKVTPDVNAWLEYARTPNSGIHADIAKFIEQNPKAAYSIDKRDDAFPVEIKHSFRSWERAGIIHSLPLDTATKLECIRGIVGSEYAVAFMRTLGSKDIPLTANEVINMIPGSDAHNRVLNWSTGSALRIDLLTMSVENLVSNLKTYTEQNQPVPVNANIKSFLKLLPDDVAQLAISQMFDMPGFANAVTNDRELMEKINRISAAQALGK